MYEEAVTRQIKQVLRWENKLEMVPMSQKVREGGSELSQLLRCKEKH